MNLYRIWWISVVVVLGVVCVRSASLSLPKDPFLGIAPEDEKYYKTSSDTIKCKDGSSKFTKSQLNDDFCDCPDGTDEPGTSACPGGKFFCQNAGHVPRLLYSSRVNDGICDCCDGSDEYDGKVNCPNICWETGKVARDKLKTKIATYQEGVSLRKQEVEQAKIALAKDEAELSKLISDEKILKGLVQQLKERKEQIERAEEKERLQKEKIEKKEKEAEEAAQKKMEPEDEVKLEESKAQEIVDSEGQATGSVHDDKGLLEDSPSDRQRMDVTEDNDDSAAKTEHSDISGNEGSLINRVEQHTVEDKEEILLPESKEESAVVPETGPGAGSEVSPDEVLESGNDASENNELSREELGRLVASRWTGEKAEKQTEEVDRVKDNDEGHEETSKYASDEEYDGYASETDDDSHKYDDDIEDEIEEDIGVEDDDSSSSYKVDSDEDESDLSDITTPSNPSWLEKIQQTVRNILQAVNLFQTPVDTSGAAHVRKEYEESSTKLSKIQSRISSLTRKLKHDLGPEKEFYSFYGRCFESKQNKYVYKVCPFKQASQMEGHSTTRLGNWDKFDDSYQVMLFSSGDKCWNGPDRSMKIKLRCGLKNEVTDVDEPSRCEYVALLSTPTLCLEEKLKELQNKLELMNKERPQSHDEL